MPQTLLKKRQYERALLNADIAANAGIELSKIAGSGDLILRNGSVAFTGNQSMGGNRLTSLADPVSPQDAATKAYVDAAVQGLDPKDSCRAATVANITLSATQTIDGVALSVGQRVLVKNQTTASQNGIYVVQATAWVRATDADTSTKVTPGLFTFIEEGTANADSGWVLSTPSPITLGTTGLAFVQFSGAGQIDAGMGLTKTGNRINAVGTAGRITVAEDNIDLASIRSGLTEGSVMLQIKDVYGRVTGENSATTQNLAEHTSALYYTDGRVRLCTLSGMGAVTNTAVIATDTILQAFPKLQGQIEQRQPLHANLTSLAGLSAVGDRLPYFQGAASFAMTVLTSQARSLLANATASDMRTTIGVVIGTDVQAQHSTLSVISTIGAAAPNGFLIKTGVNTWALDNTTYMTTANGVTLSKVRTRETPVGTINGTNKVFTLGNVPVIGSEQVFIMGQLMHAGVGNDYTISGATITFADAPIVDDIILVNYIAQ
jgi:phage-related tail fiber protein